MIIECVNCDKKFNVNSELIPNEGRTIQCGSCDHIWFFNPNDEILVSAIKQDKKKKNLNVKRKKEEKYISSDSSKKIDKVVKKIDDKKNKGSEIVKYQPQTNFTLIKFLSYILVAIISFVALIIILDTFKATLFNFYPDLEFFLFSLFETLKDIKLFVKDLF
tara:strand:- start:504 stop:989 length:486 start_codon:yes stop_codon:yes gene_type:complete